MRWTVLIPVKALPEAKSRLVPATADPAEHRRLVEAIRTDTLAATEGVGAVARVVIVADRRVDVARLRPPGSVADYHLFVQPRQGLNAALADAWQHAAQLWPAEGGAALVADLPALRADELATTLAEAADHARAFVPDAGGRGTTLLTALPGISLSPAFGPESASRHAAVAAALRAGPGLRSDVDTRADLAAAAALGLGPATTAALAPFPVLTD